MASITTMFSSPRERQRLVDARERAVERCVRHSSSACNALENQPPPLMPCSRKAASACSKFGCAGRRVMEPTPRPDDIQFGRGAPIGHPVLSAENLKGLSRRQSGGSVAAQHFEQEFGLERMGRRRSVAELGRVAVHRLDQFARAFDLAQMPHRYAEPGHRSQASVLAEAFARLPVAFRIAGRERALAMDPRFGEFAETIADDGKAAAGDADFHEAPSPSASRRNGEASSRADLSSPRTSAKVH